jgi:cellulose synthase (UDP-forming)
VRRGLTPVPLYTVFGANDLQLFFDARPLHRGDCTAIPDDVHMSVDANSTLDLTSAYHISALPNLAFFVNSGFPFTRMADLSDTALVLPQQPNSVEISAFLDLMGTLGALTFQPVSHVTVLRVNDVSVVPDKDLIVLGTLADVSGAADLLERSPYRLEDRALHVLLPNALRGVWYLFGDRTGAARERVAAAFATPLGEGGAAMIGAESPAGHARSVVALLGGSPQALLAMVETMRDPALSPSIQGDLTLLSGGTVTSYRAGGTYTVGELPFWLWPEWLLQDNAIGIVLVMLVAAAVLGLCLYRVLRWRAGSRVARRRAPQG